MSRFAIHSPAQWLEGSPRCHRPSGGDIACGVDVGVAGEPAGDTSEGRLALAVLRRDVPTGSALQRCVRGTDFLDATCSLLLEPDDQPTPSVGQDSPVQPRFLPHVPAWPIIRPVRGTCHGTDIELLDPYKIEATSEIRTDQLHPVLAPVTFASLHPGKRPTDLTASVRSRNGPLQSSSKALQPPTFAGGETGHLQQLSGRQRRRNSDPTVHSHCPAITGRRYRFGSHRERDMPPPAPVDCDPIGPRGLAHSTGQDEPDPPYLRHPEPGSPPAQLVHVTGLHTNLAKAFVSPRLTPSRAAMCSSVEVGHRLSEVPESLLLNGDTACPQPLERRTRIGQLTRLLPVAGSRRAARSPVGVLLAREVPHEPGVRAMLHQADFLDGRRQQAESRHTGDANCPRSKTPNLGRVKVTSPHRKR